MATKRKLDGLFCRTNKLGRGYGLGSLHLEARRNIDCFVMPRADQLAP